MARARYITVPFFTPNRGGPGVTEEKAIFDREAGKTFFSPSMLASRVEELCYSLNLNEELKKKNEQKVSAVHTNSERVFETL
jgi:hypothetical protein